MMRYDQLTAFAKQLRAEGINAKHEMVNGENRNGITVYFDDGTATFFTLYELNDPSNAQLLADRDFAQIRARRLPPRTHI